MPRMIQFDDGTIVRGETDGELVRNAEMHIRAAHPQLAGQLSRDEILAMAIENESRGEQDDDERDDDERRI